MLICRRSFSLVAYLNKRSQPVEKVRIKLIDKEGCIAL